MSSTALRSLFLELGYDVDLATLDKADARIREAAKVAGDEAKAVDEGSKKKTKAHGVASTAAVTGEAKQEKATRSAKKAEDEATPSSKKLDAVLKLIGVDAKAAGEFIEKFGGKAKLGMLAAGGVLALVAHKAFEFAGAFAESSEEIRDFAREARIGTDDLQQLRHAAVAGGVGVDRMNSALTTFGQALRQGERWGNGTTFMLRRLGITTRDANHHIRPTSEVLDEVAVAMEHVHSPTRRLMVATQLFGESGRRMLDIMHTGAGGIRALRNEMEALGGGVTPQAIAAGREYTAATERMSRAQDSLRSVLATTLLPVLSWVVTGLARLGGLMANLTKGTHVMQIALAALGVVGAAVALSLLAAWAPVLAPYLGIAAAVAALVLILDDLITFVDGGDSAVGRLIDSMFGVGTATEYVHELRAEWEFVQNAIEGVIRATADFLGMSADRGGIGRFDPAAQARRMGIPVRGSGRTEAAPMRFTPAEVAAVPAMARVAAPATVGARTVIRSTTHNHGDIHVHGLTNPEQAAQRVGEILDERARNQRDADSPLQAQEG